MRWASLLLFLLTAVAAPVTSECSSCCPPSTDDGPSWASPNCCGENCGDRLGKTGQRACVGAARTDAAKSQALPVAPAGATKEAAAAIHAYTPVDPWLPSLARPGTRPLRL